MRPESLFFITFKKFRKECKNYYDAILDKREFTKSIEKIKLLCKYVKKFLTFA